MKGLLHRLAARAAGTAVPVRSDVRLPFGGGGVAPDDMARTVVVPRHPVAGRSLSPGVPREPPASHPPEQVPNDRDAGMPRPLLDPAVAELSRASRPSDDPAAGPGLRLGSDAKASELDAVPSRHAERAPSVSRPVRTFDEPPPSRPREAPLPDALLAPRSDRDPAPLMPSRDRGVATAPTAAPNTARPPAWSAATAHVAASEPAEVHVHIGRIDVTALRESVPAPQRRPAATPAPMSLEAYLAQRGRA